MRSSDKTPDKRRRKAVARQTAAAPRVSARTALSTLLELMAHSDKDHVRVSAAKIILARVTAQEEQKMRKAKPKHEPERQAALDAIARLLDELAAAKIAGDAGAAALDQHGAAQPTDAAG